MITLTAQELKESENEGGSMVFIPPDLSELDKTTLRLALHLSHAIYHHNEFAEEGLGRAWLALVEHVRLKGKTRQERRIIIRDVNIQQFGVFGENKRMYPRKTIEKVIQDHEFIPIRGYLVPSTLETEGGNQVTGGYKPDDASHEVRDLRIKNDWLVGDVHIFDSFYGAQLQVIYIHDKELSFSLNSNIFTNRAPLPDSKEEMEIVHGCQLLSFNAVTSVPIRSKTTISDVDNTAIVKNKGYD